PCPHPQTCPHQPGWTGARRSGCCARCEPPVPHSPGSAAGWPAEGTTRSPRGTPPSSGWRAGCRRADATTSSVAGPPCAGRWPKAGFRRRPEPILIGDAGEPRLPDGVAASISHSRGIAIALAAPVEYYRAVGVDLELSRLPGEAAHLLLTEPERAWLDGGD